MAKQTSRVNKAKDTNETKKVVKTARKPLYNADGSPNRFPTDDEWENMSPITRWSFIASMED